jgi:hypothetical protein
MPEPYLRIKTFKEMKHYFTPLLIVLLATCYVSAQEHTKTTTPQVAASVDHDHGHEAEAEEATPAVVNPNAAKIAFKEETYNFGEIPEGPQVTHEFKFTNTGKEPLILSNVRASCGCTTPSWPKEPVLPGKDAAILVTYNTQGRPGNFSKVITITSNSDQPSRVIDIKGEVIKADPEKSVPIEQPTMLMPKN